MRHHNLDWRFGFRLGGVISGVVVSSDEWLVSSKPNNLQWVSLHRRLFCFLSFERKPHHLLLSENIRVWVCTRA